MISRDVMFSMEVTQLIERCRQGDAEALGELYKAYAQRMRGVCRRYISDEQAISDILHDAFVIIFTSFDKLRDDRKAEAWIMSITRNVASKYKDRLKSHPFVSLENAEPFAAPNEENTIRGVPLEEVMKLIDKLPEGYGNVFRLSVFDGMSHNEIANILGIEPHSSSSQLARAKKMLRKMMQQYWLAMLLLLLFPVTFFLFKKADTAFEGENPVVATQKDITKEVQKDSRTEDDSEHKPSPPKAIIAQHVDYTNADTVVNIIAHYPLITDTIKKDTAKGIHEVIIPHFDVVDHLSKSQHSLPIQKWSVHLAYVGGFGEVGYNRPYGFTVTPMLATSEESPSPVTFENWSDYAAFLSEMPDDGSSHIRNLVMNIALNNARDDAGAGTDKIVRKYHHHIPTGFSLALKYRLTNRFALETGLGYSIMKSEFVLGSNGNTISEQQTILYIGIPLKGIYTIYNRKAWNIYGSIGVTTELPLYSSWGTSYYLHGILEASENTTINAPWQWSVGTGFGLQYNFTPYIGLFAEPNLQYYIPTGCPIETYRTERSLAFSLPIGIRFTW